MYLKSYSQNFTNEAEPLLKTFNSVFIVSGSERLYLLIVCSSYYFSTHSVGNCLIYTLYYAMVVHTANKYCCKDMKEKCLKTTLGLGERRGISLCMACNLESKMKIED